LMTAVWRLRVNLFIYGIIKLILRCPLEDFVYPAPTPE
jgi:hypothetical protein